MKKHHTIVWVCSLAGIALGYWSGFLHGTTSSPHSKKEEPAASPKPSARAPGFERGRKMFTTASRESSSRSSLLDMDTLFSKYNSMTPDQIRDEVTRLHEIIKNETIPTEEANTILYSLCYKWGQLSPKQALAYADSQTTGMSFSHAAIIRGWVAENPEAAFRYYQENKKDAPRSSSILEIIARGMAHAAPDGAFKWLNSLEEKDKRHAFPAILTNMAREHPERLAEFTAKVPPETLDKYGLCVPLTRHWAACDWDAARQWIDTLPSSMKETALEAAADALVLQNPDQATQIWKELPEARQQQMSEHIVRKLADKSAIQSLEWITRHADESQSLPLTRHVVNYSNSASKELKDYALSMPESARKDYVLGQIVDFSSSYHFYDSSIDCAENMILTDHIKDPETRMKCRQNMIYAWTQENPGQAEQWISSRPEQERNEYQEKYEEALRKKKN